MYRDTKVFGIINKYSDNEPNFLESSDINNNPDNQSSVITCVYS
jgi:hypothetical protein